MTHDRTVEVAVGAFVLGAGVAAVVLGTGSYGWAALLLALGGGALVLLGVRRQLGERRDEGSPVDDSGE